MLQKQVVKEYMENAVYDFIDDDGTVLVRDLEADAINFFEIGDEDYDNQDLILDTAIEVSQDQEQNGAIYKSVGAAIRDFASDYETSMKYTHYEIVEMATAYFKAQFVTGH